MKKVKVTTIVGTRPEIIRLSSIIKKLDVFFDHKVIHTGQNLNPLLNEVFFKDLDLRNPDSYLEGSNESLGDFLGKMFVAIEEEFLSNRPDAVLILGDTNSALSAILAKRFNIPIYHLEAGNRSFDLNVPEEINRKIVDHVADFNLVYTERARNNLLAEGLHPRKIALIGSPMKEVIEEHKHKFDKSNVLETLKITKKNYFLVSVHRQENVTEEGRIRTLFSSLERVSREYKIPVLVSVHPRTRKRLEELAIQPNENLLFHEPFGFVDYNCLQLNAKAVLSDSGSISEEAAILGFPAITLRNSMERPEALEAGTIIMSGIDADAILQSLTLLESNGLGSIPPIEYEIPDTSTRVINIIQSTVNEYYFWNGIRKPE
jgi:UDP-N-acetylglucosamine 2-epimerase (non-hydrolysing)